MLTRLLCFTIGGGLTGLALSFLVLNGYFVQWQMLPPTPFPDPHLVNVVGQRLFIRFSDSTTYTCLPKTAGCWRQEDIPASDPGLPSRMFSECQLPLPMTIITARPPQIQECLQGVGNHTDASSDFAYVRDPQGRLWEWFHFNQPRLQTLLPQYFSRAGGILGLLIGGIRELWRKLMRRRRTTLGETNDAR